MPLVYYVPEYERDAKQIPLDAERLLRLLGVTGKLSGFRYAVYMVEQVRDQPDDVLLITKRLYKQTADHFNTTPSCVERNLRTLIQSCWNQLDHDFLNVIAGTQLRQPPTNSQFIDMMAAIWTVIQAALCRLSLFIPAEMWLNLRQISTRLPFGTGASKGVPMRAGDSLCSLSISSKLFAP